MLKDLLKEGGLYTLANFLTKGISLLLIPFYTSYFSPADYGVIDLLTLFGLFVMNVFNLQLNQGLARYVAEPTLTSLEKKEYASTAIWSSFLLFTLGFFVLFYFSDEVLDLLSNEQKINKSTYLLALSAILLNGVFYMLGIHLRSLRMSKEFSILSFSHALLGIVLVLLFVIWFDLGINSIYMSFVILVPFLIGVEFYLLRNQISLTLKWKILEKLLFFCLPLIPASLAIVVMNFSDRIYIKEYLNFSELGIYAMGTKFATIIGLIIGGFTMAITPLIVQNQYEEKTKKELSNILNLFISLGTIGVLLLSLFSGEIVILFTNNRFHSAANVMPMMFLTAYFVGFSMFSPGLMLKKKTIISASLVIIFAGLNIILNKYLIPVYGIKGAAFATLISTFFFQLLSFLISQKYYYFRIKILKIILVSLVNLGLVFFVVFWNPELDWTNFGVKVVVLSLYIFFLIKIELLKLERLMKFVKR